LGIVAVSALSEPDYQFLFSRWVEQWGKSYEHDTFFTRYNAFKANLDYVVAKRDEQLIHPGHEPVR